jgi:hypothetical protein
LASACPLFILPVHYLFCAYPAEDPNVNPSPEKIMPLYLYLMGEDSKGVTGQALDAQPK